VSVELIVDLVSFVVFTTGAFLFVRWRRRELDAMERDRQELEQLRDVLRRVKRSDD